ncbi:PBP1A family penicillin-binding protein [Pontibacillus sp. HMF3514]|uniref:PBP1A family penicillin-binding protein n=1 Tax=Pontibacillus sp. HMF3514 TaxID=2692425 RepID=UPI00132017F9|nr:PBP1A family penicillin-binding protein [Pontibacillus sp. HMF3514]QHE52486.1 PBP1A family penicillin-binding protein [Pontibacillus sp. HMF3514]
MAQNSQSRTARKKELKQSKKQNQKPIMKRMIMAILVLGVIGAIGIGSLFIYYVQGAPELNPDKLSSPISAKFYDKDDNLFAELGAQKRTKITQDQIPEVVEKAVIATEDSRFYDHMGIDFRRILAAVYANITEGYGAEGASTITQQVVKNAFLSQKKTLERKVQEQWLALKLEQKYSKDEILTMYLNKIYYANDAYGIAKAADLYFNKKLSELTLPEAALLAGIPQRPAAYDPFDNPDLAQERKNIVLKLMVQHGKITEQEAAEAKKVKVESLVTKESDSSNIPYDSFLEQAIKEVEQKLNDVNIYEDGVKVYTTLDPKAQKRAEELLGKNSPLPFPDKEFQTGLAVLDTKSGAIRAIGGGRNKDKVGATLNYATQLKGRQPGSTFKPIVDYGPAIEHLQWSTYHLLKDEPYKYKTPPHKDVNNWDGDYLGTMTMRRALALSRNVPAAKTLAEVGLKRAQKFAEGLGINFESETMHESNAIGGASTGVTPLQLAASYSAFGNEGVYNEPYAVRRVEFQGSRSPVEFKNESHVAMKDYTAYMISDMLKDVVQWGTGTRAKVPGVPVAGKTGTTNNEHGTPDSWFTGYTTNYTISVWSGYPSPKNSVPASAKYIPQQAFSNLMGHISQGIDTPDFKKPSSVVKSPVEMGTKPPKLPSEFTPEEQIKYELFVEGTEPQEKSDQFEKLDPVKDLKAEFDEEKGTVKLTWDYEADEDKQVSFNIAGSPEGQPMQSIAEGYGNTQLEVSNLQKGETYTFEVVAVSDKNPENKSDPNTVTIDIPEKSKLDDLLDDLNGDDDKKDKKKDKKKDNDEDNQDDSGSNNNDSDSSGSDSTNDGSSTDDSSSDGSGSTDSGSTDDSNTSDSSSSSDSQSSDDAA